MVLISTNSGWNSVHFSALLGHPEWGLAFSQGHVPRIPILTLSSQWRLHNLRYIYWGYHGVYRVVN